MTMLYLLALTMTASAQDSCAPISAIDVIDIDAPAVIVLGERRGTLPDLSRAERVTRALGAKAPVTLAVEAIRAEQNTKLQRFRSATPDLGTLEQVVDWNEHWAYPFEPYRDLLTVALTDDPHKYTIVAAGTPLVPPLDSKRVHVPGGYADHLANIAGETLPRQMQGRLAEAMAWADREIASAAVEAWDGKGYLIIVTDRTRVEGGMGVNWQVEQLSNRPVHSFALGWGDPPCHSGDLVWRQPMWRANLPIFMLPRKK